MNHKKVQRIMKKYHLKPQYTKRIKNKSYKRIEENVKPNLVNRNFNTDSPNRIWTTDITYLILNNKRAYLSTILDLYDRKIVAYKISYRNDLNIVIDTLNPSLAPSTNSSYTGIFLNIATKKIAKISNGSIDNENFSNIIQQPPFSKKF